MAPGAARYSSTGSMLLDVAAGTAYKYSQAVTGLTKFLSVHGAPFFETLVQVAELASGYVRWGFASGELSLAGPGTVISALKPGSYTTLTLPTISRVYH